MIVNVFFLLVNSFLFNSILSHLARILRFWWVSRCENNVCQLFPFKWKAKYLYRYILFSAIRNEICIYPVLHSWH